ncbi:MAG: glucosyltransferase, partial [Alphaproteobacteria bacterium]
MVAALLAWVVNIILVGAALGCIHMLLACVLVRRFARRRTPDVSQSPPVSILQPLHGSEPRLLDRCASLCRQNYAGPVQLVLGTHDPADPAIEVIGRLQKIFPGEQIALKIDPSEHGTNRKISNLINMMPLARHDIIVTLDSDIEVGPHYLSML